MRNPDEMAIGKMHPSVVTNCISLICDLVPLNLGLEKNFEHTRTCPFNSDKDNHERSKSLGFEHCLNYFKILEGAVVNGNNDQPNVQPPPPPAASNPTSNEPKDMSSIIEKLKSNRRSSNSSRFSHTP